MVCRQEGQSVTYIGESSNSLSERAGQHVKDATDPSKESHMRRHVQEEHPGEVPSQCFTIKVITPHLTALSRQVEEAFLIKTHKSGTLLNTKYEYHHGILPSLCTTDPRVRVEPEAYPNPDKFRSLETEVFAAEKRRIRMESQHQPEAKRRKKNLA